MKPGTYDNVEINAYHAGAGISNSGLGAMLQSPYHFWSRHINDNRPDRPQTLPQEDGQVAHCAILEPDEFTNRYVVGPDAARNSNIWKDFCQIHDEKTVIKPEQYTRAMLQRDACWKIPDIRKALSKGKAEVSAYWKDPETGVLCRCRPDFVHEADAGVVLVDVKTYSDARPDEFSRQCARMKYHRQDAFYSDGYGIAANVKVLAFIFLSVEMPWPHAAAAAILDEDSRRTGISQYRFALDRYAKCLKEDHWPGYSDTISEMRLPEWAIEKSL